MSLLEVDGLSTHFVTRDIDNRLRVAKALSGVSFSLDAGRVLGIIGETGAGKSLTAQSICGLLKPPARIVGGRVIFDGQELTAMSPAALNDLRGAQIALVVQNPRTSLDPLSRVGEQLVRIHQAHGRHSLAASRQRALQMLAAVGIPDPAGRVKAWPHELSGGMAQRVLIAMALMNGPRLLIADEPTTGLDVTVQAQILDLMRDLVQRFGMATIIITHDLGVVAHYCDEVAVMFAGTIVEIGPVGRIFGAPGHPYTRALIASTPERRRIGQGGAQIGGEPPDLFDLPSGCPVRLRCTHATPDCSSTPPERTMSPGHLVRCHHAGRLGETTRRSVA